MKKEIIGDHLLNILSDIARIPVSQILPDSNLRDDLSLDSLDMINLKIEADKDFEVEINTSHLSKCKTVVDLENIILAEFDKKYVHEQK